MNPPKPPPHSFDSTLTSAAGTDDPWALTPEEQADLDARTARRLAECDAIPDEPPF